MYMLHNITLHTCTCWPTPKFKNLIHVHVLIIIIIILLGHLYCAATIIIYTLLRFTIVHTKHA